MFLKRFVGFLFLFNISSSFVETTWVDYRLTSVLDRALPSSDPPVCTVPGKVCGANCKDIYVCLGNNEPLLATTCGTNQTCNNGVCSSTPSEGCSATAKKLFVCRSEGILPDPFDCSKYHICVKDSATTFINYDRTCSSEQAYNPRTTYCDKKLFNGKCTGYPVPLCKTPGQTGIISGNPSLFYICLIYDEVPSTANPIPNEEAILYPYLFICPNGKSYNGNYSCK